MEHPIFRVVDFKIVSLYQLQVTFDDGHVQVIDFKPILSGEIYEGSGKEEGRYSRILEV